MGVVYLGTARFAADLLERLASGRWRPDLVVSRPDAPQGRGRRLAPPPVAEKARQLGLQLIQPDDVGSAEVADRVREACGPEGRVVLCAYGALIGDPLLSEHEIVNVHPSLLPRWRGAAPIERAIAAGDAETGVSVMRLVQELDAGPVYGARATPIAPHDTFGSLSERLVEMSAALLGELLGDLPDPAPQDEAGVTYAEKIGPADRTVDPADPEGAERMIRALHPHIGARVELPGGGFLGIEEATVTPEGTLRPVTVRPAGGRSMPYEDYLRGNGTPPLGL